MKDERDEISIKELILKVREYIQIIWSNKIPLIGVSLLFGLGFAINAYFKPTTYTAELTFMVNDDDGGMGMAGIGAILGQFGMGAVGSNYNYHKIIKIANSNRIIGEVITDSIKINEKLDIAGNHIIDLYKLQKSWSKDTLLCNFKFETKKLNIKNNLAKSIIVKKLIGNPLKPQSPKLLNISFEEESSIITLEVTSENDELSLALAKSWYFNLSKFYIDKSTERQRQTYEQLKVKADSVFNLLTNSENTLASHSDKLGLSKFKDNLGMARSSRDITIYSSLYAEVLKNLETSDFLLKNATPFFQYLDLPLAPISKNPKGVIVQFIIGLFIGIFLTVSILIGLVVVKNVMNT